MRRRQTIETAQGRQVGGARQAGDGAGSGRGPRVAGSVAVSLARATDLLGCAAARSSALINKLTVKYLRPIREAAVILLSLCLVIDPLQVINVFFVCRSD